MTGLWIILAVGEYLLVVRRVGPGWGNGLVGIMLTFAVGYVVTLVNLRRHPELVAPARWSRSGRRDAGNGNSRDNPYRST